MAQDPPHGDPGTTAKTKSAPTKAPGSHPFAGMTRIRFSGSPLQLRGLSVPVAGHPGERGQSTDARRPAQEFLDQKPPGYVQALLLQRQLCGSGKERQMKRLGEWMTA